MGVLVGYGAWHDSVGRSLELASVDGRFQIRGERKPWPGVVIVGIDATATHGVRELPVRPPPRRESDHRLLRDGARTVAFDLIFDHPSNDPGADLALLDAAKRAGHRLVLAANATNSTGGTFVLGGRTGGLPRRQRELRRRTPMA